MRLRFNTYFFTLILTISLLLVTPPVSAETYELPVVNPGDIDLDGNINDSEWSDAVLFNTTIAGRDAKIRVTSDGENILIALLYTTTTLNPVNDTVDSPLSYNNQTHDWLMLQIDNNLDGKELATESSPDDALIFDYFRSGEIIDAVVNDNDTQIFTPDITLTENNPFNQTLTEFAGINGTNNQGAYAYLNNTRDGGVTYDRSFEISKDLYGTDINGSDFNLNYSRIFKFKFNIFENAELYANLDTGYDNLYTTDWFSVRINETGTGVSLTNNTDIKINLKLDTLQEHEYLGFAELLSSYGYDVTITKDELFSYNDFNLSIFIFDQHTTETDIFEFEQYARHGGNAIVFVGQSSPNSDFFDELGIDYLKNSMLQSNDTEEITLESSDINSDVKWFSGESQVTDVPISSLKFTSGAFNLTNTFNKTELPYIYSQEYFIYDFFPSLENTTYDMNNDNKIGQDEIFDHLTTGFGIDFEFGGRLSFFASTSIIKGDYLTVNDNALLVLKMLPWNSRNVDTIQINEVSVEQHH
ncbi:MAG: hypothetical protein OEZ01_03580, partial [Candidatus Heimdallarchaeota archaeon]|nr:hypothetical protein [Candidatus Heimdallarchaeota archaeon]